MISHQHKCIFIHIPKNGGQSMEHVFLDLLGLTWETRAPLLLRPNDIPLLGPPQLGHLHADEYVKNHYISEELFRNYFKFTFVRNPWDRMVSIYKYSRHSLVYDFKFFVNHIFIPKIWSDKYWFIGPQSEFIINKSGNIMIDFIGRFETMQSDFNEVCKRLGLPETPLPHVNKSSQKVKNPGLNLKQTVKYLLWQFSGRRKPVFQNYQDYYDSETEQIVKELYRSDIELFGYIFNGGISETVSNGQAAEA